MSERIQGLIVFVGAGLVYLFDPEGIERTLAKALNKRIAERDIQRVREVKCHG